MGTRFVNIYGEPASGKTALARSLARHLRRLGHRVHFEPDCAHRTVVATLVSGRSPRQADVMEAVIEADAAGRGCDFTVRDCPPMLVAYHSEDTDVVDAALSLRREDRETDIAIAGDGRMEAWLSRMGVKVQKVPRGKSGAALAARLSEALKGRKALNSARCTSGTLSREETRHG